MARLRELCSNGLLYKLFDFIHNTYFIEVILARCI